MAFVAKSRRLAKSSPTFLQNGFQNQQKNLQNSIKKSIKNQIRVFIVFYFQNGSKMIPKWDAKKWENLALATLGGQGEPPGAQRSPKAPKMKPRGAPRPPKWLPRGAQRPQNDAQATPRAATMEPKRPPRRSKDRRTSPAVGFTNFGGGANSKLVQPIADDARYPKDRPLNGGHRNPCANRSAAPNMKPRGATLSFAN